MNVVLCKNCPENLIIQRQDLIYSSWRKRGDLELDFISWCSRFVKVLDDKNNNNKDQQAGICFFSHSLESNRIDM